MQGLCVWPMTNWWQASEKIFGVCMQEARKLGQNYISSEHVVLALFSVGNVGVKQVIDR